MGQLEDMTIFVRIVDAGGIGKAAEQLNMAKSAVSRRLVALETRLNSKLLIRTTRKSNLTEAGANYYHKAIKIIDDVSELNTQINGTNTALEGTLRMALPLSFGIMHLTPLIDEFKQQHPNLSLKIDFSDRQVDLIEESYELAIRIATLKDSSLQAKRISVVEHVICASPSYLKKHGTPTNTQQLADHQILQYGINNRQTLQLITPQQQLEEVEVNPQIAANNGVFLENMAIAGHGIIYLPRFIVYQSLKQQTLLPILEDHQLPVNHIYAVYPQNRFLSQRARLFIDFIAQKFTDQSNW